MDDSGQTSDANSADDAAFETLLWRLFLHFIDLPANQVDDAVREALRQCCTALGLDRSSVWQKQPGDEEDLQITHNFEARVVAGSVDERTGSLREGPARIFPLAGGRAYPAASSAKASFPWFLSRTRAGLTTVVSAVEDLPGDAAVDVESFRRIGTVSTVIVPLKTDAGVLGCVSFASTTNLRQWTEPLVRRFELIGQVLARALNAKRITRLLRESEATNRATFEQAAVGIAHVAPDGSWLRVNDKLCDILGYRREELVGGMTFQDLTYPDDLQSDLEQVRALLSGRQATYLTEKRYVRRNASVIWANLTVSLVRDADGRPKHFISIVEDITDRRRTEEQLRVALADLQSLRDRLQHENLSLRDEIQRRGPAGLVVGTSPAIRAALALADQVAPTGATVLLLGETGTGKERFANYIHEHSPRRGRAMVRVNCAAIPTTLIESELFGREKGAFTGALARQIGRFELASGSTIFLDEIGDLPIDVQVKLLRVIEERCIERLGNPRPVPVDVRIIAATHRDLHGAVREGQFREDLFYRLNVFPIALPPLRERLDDIPLLARAMVDELGKTMGKRFDALTHGALQALRRYRWPGNIRELRNVIERAMITSTSTTLDVTTPAAATEPRPLPSSSALKDVERAHVLGVLAETGWRIRGPHGAAAVLGIPPTTLENRMKRLGISRPKSADRQR